MNDDIAELATTILEEQGFTLKANGHFEGKIHIENVGPFSAEIELPYEFPSKLPEIFLRESELPRRMAHVEANGKVCIAHTTGILLNRYDPKGIICESIDRAREVLCKGLTGESDTDWLTELLAYWNRLAPMGAISIVRPNSSPRPISLLYALAKTSLPNGRRILFAENHAEARTWAERFNTSLDAGEPGFYLPLSTSPAPNIAFELPTPKGLLDELQGLVDHRAWEIFRGWLRRVVLPATVLLSLPSVPGRSVIGVEFEGQVKNAKGEAYVFRKGQRRALNEIGRSPSIRRYQIDRFDPDFVIPRGGADLTMIQKTVLVIGGGAVGSFVAKFLALAGIGRIRLVDFETLTSENIHRHLLGADSVGKNKAEELARVLSPQFPNTQFEYKTCAVESLLRINEKDFFVADALINATGDETLGLDLNQKFGGTHILAHVWNDPMGIGGHCLVSFPGHQGCYECLFVNDIESGHLHNSASFSRPNQTITKSFAGCAGVFVPFSALDAVRTALECSKLIATTLNVKTQDGLLVSWFGDPAAFLAEGFALSRRASLFSAGEVSRVSTFHRTDCDVCRNRT